MYSYKRAESDYKFGIGKTGIVLFRPVLKIPINLICSFIITKESFAQTRRGDISIEPSRVKLLGALPLDDKLKWEDTI